MSVTKVVVFVFHSCEEIWLLLFVVYKYAWTKLTRIVKTKAKLGTAVLICRSNLFAKTGGH